MSVDSFIPARLNIFPTQTLLSVFVRRNPVIFFEAIAEIVLIAITALLRYFKYLHRGTQKQIARRFHPPFGHKGNKIL